MPKCQIVVTLFTPFDSSNRVDHRALRESIAFYRDCGVDGVFANCQTSETLRLSADEQVAIVETIANCHCGLTIYSGMNCGADLPAQAGQLRRIREAGADLPVVWLSTLPNEKPLDEELLAMADLVSVDLGIYECPDPVHRLLDDAQLERIAQSGRFTFFKDTCRDNAVFARRMALIADTRLASYQANWKCLPQSVLDGAAGFSGWLAAARPDAVVAYWDFDREPKQREVLHEALFALQEAMRAARYPASGKFLLHKRVPAFEATMRNGESGLLEVDPTALAQLEAADAKVDDILKGCS